eukprot:TRINITY_DN3280_c0_g1_i1.p1 TRINITY_DN3280_c0_g1~~TRINITY_DN3280_c0_g1_i1.p1  ORF type:complete len:271 (-),score=22.72 TRINITY_DN3280_c0_g1_i1:133-945(-)
MSRGLGDVYKRQVRGVAKGSGMRGTRNGAGVSFNNTVAMVGWDGLSGCNLTEPFGRFSTSSLPYTQYGVHMQVGTTDGRLVYYYDYRQGQGVQLLYTIVEVNLTNGTASDLTSTALASGVINRDGPVRIVSGAPGTAAYMTVAADVRAAPSRVTVKPPTDINVADINAFDLAVDPLSPSDRVWVFFRLLDARHTGRFDALRIDWKRHYSLSHRRQCQRHSHRDVVGRHRCRRPRPDRSLSIARAGAAYVVRAAADDCRSVRLVRRADSAV